MGCFRQLFRSMLAPFKREQPRVLEIGPPTNFRKEEPPACFSDADTLTSQDSHGIVMEKSETTIETVACPPSPKGMLRSHVRRMSIKLSQPASEIA